jgi:hypothetical protein
MRCGGWGIDSNLRWLDGWMTEVRQSVQLGERSSHHCCKRVRAQTRGVRGSEGHLRCPRNACSWLPKRCACQSRPRTRPLARICSQAAPALQNAPLFNWCQTLFRQGKPTKRVKRQTFWLCSCPARCLKALEANLQLDCPSKARRPRPEGASRGSVHFNPAPHLCCKGQTTYLNDSRYYYYPHHQSTYNSNREQAEFVVGHNTLCTPRRWCVRRAAAFSDPSMRLVSRYTSNNLPSHCVCATTTCETRHCSASFSTLSTTSNTKSTAIRSSISEQEVDSRAEAGTGELKWPAARIACHFLCILHELCCLLLSCCRGTPCMTAESKTTTSIHLRRPIVASSFKAPNIKRGQESTRTSQASCSSQIAP